MNTINKKSQFVGKTVNRLLVILFAVLLCSVLAVISTDDSAALPSVEEFTVADIHYEVISEVELTVEVTGYDLSGHLTIPDVVNNGLSEYSVISIGEGAFEDREDLTTVTIGNNVETIGEEAFTGTNTLNLTMPIDLIITEGMFDDFIDLTSITLTRGNTGIGASYSTDVNDSNCYQYTPWYLSRNTLSSITIEDNVKSIGANTFKDCSNLERVTIGKNVRLIAADAFTDFGFYLSDGITEIDTHSASNLKGYTYTGTDSDELIRQSTIIFKYGEYIIKTLNVDYNEFIEAPADLKMDPTLHYTYTFEWVDYEAGVTTAIGNKTFTGEFTEVGREYTIIFEHINDPYESFTYTLAYDQIIDVPAGTPTKASTNTEVFTFVWADYEEGVTKVTGNETFYGEFISETRTYAITFTNGDDVVTQNLEYDAVITAPANPEQAPTDTIVYTGSWDGYTVDPVMNVTGDQNFNAIFSGATRYYEITFNNDGDVVTQNLEYNAVITAPANPTKAPTDTIVYTGSWDGYTVDPVMNVTGDQNFNAIFSEATRYYEITFNNDGDVVTQNLEYNAVITAPANPTKAPTDTIVYTGSWDGYTVDPVMNVTGDQNFNAIFSEATRYYEITFNNDGDVVTQNLEYNAVITAPANPTKAPTDTIVYTGSWDGYTVDPVMNVTGDQNFNAIFSEATRYYEITFNNDGDVVTQNLEYNAVITAPANPTKAPTDTIVYTGSWDGYTVDPVMNVTGDQNFNAIFSEATRYYEITFNNDGDVVTQNLEYNAVITAPANPTKAPTDTIVYTGSWDGYTVDPVMNVTGDQNFNAIFSEATRYYEITFTNDGEVFETQNLEFNADITEPVGTPVRDSSNTEVYTFTVWEGYTAGTTKVSADQDFAALYSIATRTYTIDFKTGIITHETLTLEFNELITPTVYLSQAPTNTEVFTFAWVGHEQGVTRVTGDQIFEGEFTSEVRYYTINFMNGVEVFDTQNLEFDAVIIAPTEIPTKESSNTTVFTFSEWTGHIEGMQVSDDEDFIAFYDEDIRTYAITFTNDGEVFETQNLEFNADITEPVGTPVRDSSNTEVYTFTVWEGYTAGTTKVSADQDFAALYSIATRTYTIDFKTGIITHETLTLEFNELITPTVYLSQAPTNTEVFTFAWVGHEQGVTRVTGDQIFEGEFTSEVRYYTINFMNGVEVFDTQNLEFDAVIIAPTEIPTKESSNTTVFTFSEWTGHIEGMQVSDDEDFIAFYDEDIRTYTISWKVDGVTFKTETLEYDTVIVAPADLEKESTEGFDYTLEWTDYIEGVTKVTGDEVIIGTFNPTDRVYTITWKVDGFTFKKETLAYDTVIVAPEPVKDSTDTKVYTLEWTNYFADQVMKVEENMTFIGTFNETERLYTVTWFVDGSEADKVETLAYEVLPSYGPTIITDEFTYTNIEWDVDPVPVVADVTYTALPGFVKTSTAYTVTWMDGEVEVSTQTADHGTAMTVPATPTKPATVQYEEQTSVWNAPEDYTGDMVTITGDVTFTAVYNDLVLNQYTVTWMDGEVEVSTQTADHGTAMTVPATPTKPATVQYEEQTSVWNAPEDYTGDMVTITGDVTFTAVYNDLVLNQYTVTWMDGEVEVSTQTADHGTAMTVPATPTKPATVQYEEQTSVWNAPEDYTGDMVTITGDVTFTAVYNDLVLNQYTVTWMDGEVEVSTQTADHGTAMTVPATPTKPATVQYEEQTSVWNAPEDYTGDMVTITGDVTFTAVYNDLVLNQYTVTWMDGEVEVSTQTADHGTAMTVPATPTKPATVQYEEQTSVWNAPEDYTGDMVTITGDVTFTAVYNDLVLNQYTVTWMDGEVEVSTQTADHGTAMTVPATPTKPATVQYEEQTSVWNAPEDYTGDMVTITGDVTFTAVYNDLVLNQYTVTWMDGEVEVSTQTADHGTAMTVPATPTKPATVQYEEQTSVWNAPEDYTGDMVTITGDVTFTAVYNDLVLNQYTVTWMDGEVEVSTQTADHGTAMTVPATPTKPATVQYEEQTSVWNAPEDYTGDMVTITGDVTFTAVYNDLVLNQYTVTWMDGEVEVSTQTADHGTAMTVPATPTKPATVQYEEQTSVWNAPEDYTGDMVTITGDVTFTAVYNDLVLNQYTVTWKVDGTETTSEVAYGVMPSYGEVDPVRAATDEFTYTFDGWDPEVDEVTGDATYTAQFEATPIDIGPYTIIFKYGSITVKTMELNFGDEIIAPKDLKKSSTEEFYYTFEWLLYEEGMTASIDQTFYGKFTAVPKGYPA